MLIALIKLSKKSSQFDRNNISISHSSWWWVHNLFGVHESIVQTVQSNKVTAANTKIKKVKTR